MGELSEEDFNPNEIIPMTPELKEEFRIIHNASMRGYYRLNKEKYSKKYYCECGGRYTISYKSHHNKTKKHQEYVKNGF